MSDSLILQSPLKRYVPIDVYYEAHEAVLSAKTTYSLDQNAANLRILSLCYRNRAQVFEKLCYRDQLEIVTKLFPGELGVRE